MLRIWNEIYESLSLSGWLRDAILLRGKKSSIEKEDQRLIRNLYIN